MIGFEKQKIIINIYNIYKQTTLKIFEVVNYDLKATVFHVKQYL